MCVCYIHVQFILKSYNVIIPSNVSCKNCNNFRKNFHHCIVQVYWQFDQSPNIVSQNAVDDIEIGIFVQYQLHIQLICSNVGQQTSRCISTTILSHIVSLQYFTDSIIILIYTEFIFVCMIHKQNIIFIYFSDILVVQKCAGCQPCVVHFCSVYFPAFSIDYY